MKKRLPILAVLILIVFVGAGTAVYLERENQKLETRVRLLAGKQRVMEKAFEAKRIWQEGTSVSVDQNCQDLDATKYDDNVIRRARQCSADFLSCWLKNLEGDVVASKAEDNSWVKLEFNHTGKRAIFTLKDRASGFESTYQLADSCRDVYLPQNRYATAPLHPQNNDWQWDNYDKAIFVDKSPVSVRDVKEWLHWADFEGVEKPEILLGQEELAPATRLLAEHQELFCGYHGGFILPAHFYDAASFYPPLIQNGEARIPRGPYPEGMRKQDSYFGLQLMTGETIVLDKLCRNFYSQECRDQAPLSAYQMISLSWVGMAHVLGGEFEHLTNPRELKRNLKLSSKHFPMMSKWHEIAQRGFWDGMGFERANFNWRTQDPAKDEDFYGVTFRCARLGRVYAP